MLSKTSCLLLLFICTFFNSTAQNFIKGSVSDTTNAPVPFCALGLLKAQDSSLVKGNVTDDNGKFSFEKVPAGTYLLKFESVGFKTGWSSVLTVDSFSQLSLPPFILKAEGVSLGEVSTSAIKPIIEFKKGMVVMNVENNILAGGNTVFELLKRVPGVTVDAQNNITVDGRGGVRFLIDGRLQQIPADQLVNMLMGMPAESVSSLELIKNPPAKYDAAGSGGLINIVLKKAKLKGFSGSLSQSVSYGNKWRESSSVSINYKSNKLTLFTNLNYARLQFETNNYYERNMTDSTGPFGILTQGKQTPKRNIAFLNAGVEYELSKKTMIGLNVNGSSGKVTNRENTLGAVTGDQAFPYNYIRFHNGTKADVFNPTVNISVTHTFDTLTTLQFSADYTNYTEDFSRLTTNHYYNNGDTEVLPVNQFGTAIQNDFNIYTQKLDFTRTLKKAASIEAGFKSSFVDNGSNATVQLTDPISGQLFVNDTFSNRYRYQEQLLAGYFTLNKSYKKFDLKAGLRSEHTLINARNLSKPFELHRNYINFFPSGSVDYKLNEKHSLQANYSYRIDRPSYDQLNPALGYNDPFNRWSGNPLLKPQYIHSTNLDYNYNHFITLTAAYQRTNNMIYYYSYGSPTSKITIDTVFNYPHRNNASLSAFVQKQISWFSVNGYVAGMFRSFRGTVNGNTANSETFQYYGNCTFEFTLPKQFKIQLQGFYSSGFKDGVQYYYPMGVANITVSKSIIDKKLDVSLSMFDVFYSERQPYINEVGGQYVYYVERNDSRRIRLFVIWKFGKMKINQNIKRSNDEENNRLKQVN